MPASRIFFHTGQPSFVEIHIATPAPLDWLNLVRYAFTSLLDWFHEPLPVDAAGLQRDAFRVLSLLRPLPAQLQAGTFPPDTVSGTDEMEGYYLTPDGLVIRLQVAVSAGELDTMLRAIIAVGQHSGCRLSDEIRAGYFELLSAFISSSYDISATAFLST